LDDCAADTVDCYDGSGSGITGYAGPACPNRRLEAFYGTDKIGPWTLRVADVQPGEVGSLVYWALRFESLVMPNDSNYNGIPDECEVTCELMGDMNGNGVVNGDYIQGFVSAMVGQYDPCADFNINWQMDMADVDGMVDALLGL
jgi:hypothetical protein